MKIRFMPMNIEVEATPEKSVLQLANENKIQIRSICKGVPSCAECRVKIQEGESNVLPPTKDEINLIGSSYFVDHRRLSCQLRCFGDVTLDLTEQVGKSDTANKKVRGLKKGQQPTESRAIQDTMLLQEKSPDKDQHKDHQGKTDKSS